MGLSLSHFLPALLLVLAAAKNDPTFDLFFDPERPAARLLFLPGTTVPKHLDTDGYFEKIIELQRHSSGSVFSQEELQPSFKRESPSDFLNLVRTGRYAEALAAAPADEHPSFLRVEEIRKLYASLNPADGQWARAAMQAISDFAAGRDAHAVLRASYALSLNPAAPGLPGLLRSIERTTGLEGVRIPSGTGLSLLEVKLAASKDLFKAGRHDAMIRSCRDVLILKPVDATALARLGSGFFLKRQFSSAAAVWRLAAEQEERAGEKSTLNAMIARAESEIRTAKAARIPEKIFDPVVLESLHKDALALHAAGKVEEAREAFERILNLSPSDKKAKKALRRLR